HPFLAFLGGVTITTTYGYLSDEQFEFAYNEIKSFWNSFRTKKTELLVQIDKIKDLIRKTANLYKIFQKNFTWISEQLSRLKIKDKDTDQFVKMQGFVFQYPDFDKDLIEKEKSLDNLYEEIINKPYNPCETGKFDQWEIHLQNKLNEIKHYYIFLKTCLKTQLKYIEIKQKILTFLEIRKN
ncbi:MAG: hypothetical protein COX43_04445, partial [Parcubacteria group bacterium CG23_combo_of_CG06-09_8_20_14_all_35_9]